MNVRVISRETIKPSNPTPKRFLYHHFSLLDQVNRQTFAPFLFFYSPKVKNNFNPNVSNPNIISTEKMVTRLKESLASALTIFYPFAGRIQLDTNCPRYILCNDRGVPYWQGQVLNRSLFDVVNKVEISELDKLLPSELMKAGGQSEFPVIIQVNVFACGGIAISICLSHKVFDGFSLYTFVKTWADITAQADQDGNAKNDLLVPYFDMAKMFPLSNNCPSFELQEEEQDDHVLVAKRFVFSAQKLFALKARYSSGEQVRISSGLVLLAFIYERIVSCSKHRNINHEILQAANIRHLIDPPPLKHFYFGNVMVKALTSNKPSTTTKGDIFIDVVDRMRDSITKIDADFVRKVQNGEENLDFMVDSSVRAKKGEVISIEVSNHFKLPVYGSDFGWGKPIWVTFATIDVEYAIVLMPSRSGKEIEVCIYLTKEDMNKLETDVVFNSFVRPPPPLCML